MRLPVLFNKGGKADSPVPDESDEHRLSSAGKASRLIAVFAVFGLLLAGTLYGQDDHFPFGPFRMYAVAKKPNETIPSTRMEGVNVVGERVQVKGGHSGLRRAEIEGQLRRFSKKPELLDAIAAAYAERNPTAPPLARIEIIHRNYQLRDGKPTGKKTDVVVLSRDVSKVAK